MFGGLITAFLQLSSMVGVRGYIPPSRPLPLAPKSDPARVAKVKAEADARRKTYLERRARKTTTNRAKPDWF